MEQLAQDRVLQELGEVGDDDMYFVERRVVVVDVFIGELGGLVQKLALDKLEENHVPAPGLALVEQGLGPG